MLPRACGGALGPSYSQLSYERVMGGLGSARAGAERIKWRPVKLPVPCPARLPNRLVRDVVRLAVEEPPGHLLLQPRDPRAMFEARVPQAGARAEGRVFAVRLGGPYPLEKGLERAPEGGGAAVVRLPPQGLKKGNKQERAGKGGVR